MASKLEQETIIQWSEEDKKVNIFTTSDRLKKKLLKLDGSEQVGNGISVDVNKADLTIKIGSVTL